MKFLICILVFVAVVNCDDSSINNAQSYTYTDENGAIHIVRHIAGIPIAIDPNTQKALNNEGISAELLKSAVNNNDVVKVHHIRNEVPATVHRTFVPESVHAMAPPPVFSRRVIDKHQLPVYSP